MNDRDDRSWTEIAREILETIRSMFRAEMQLALIETGRKVRRWKAASTWLGAAAVLGGLAAACFVTAAIAALAMVMPLWLSALLTGLALCIAAGGALIAGRTKLAQIEPAPRRVFRMLQERASALKRQPFETGKLAP
jgi:peptidoglycan/LPS O-acetylase OafA/YrhL